jgi:hypothetical protein
MDNILYEIINNKIILKIADFGLSKEDNAFLITLCGFALFILFYLF